MCVHGHHGKRHLPGIQVQKLSQAQLSFRPVWKVDSGCGERAGASVKMAIMEAGVMEEQGEEKWDSWGL